MSHQQPIARRRVHNRILAVMTHLSRYAFCGQARLAEDSGLSRSAVSRFLAGHSNPSFALVMAITHALEAQLGCSVDPRELVSFDGKYPTASVCQLCGCKGCLPSQVYGTDDQVKPAYRHIQAGHWAYRPKSASETGEIGVEEAV